MSIEKNIKQIGDLGVQVVQMEENLGGTAMGLEEFKTSSKNWPSFSEEFMDVDWQVKASALMEADFLVAGLCTVCEAFASDMRLWGDLATTVSQILQEIFAHKQLTAAKRWDPDASWEANACGPLSEPFRLHEVSTTV